MVKEQLIRRGITDEGVLRAMSIVPRHHFVDQGFRPRAYGDYPLPIGNNQTISQPYIVALMCQELTIPGNGGKKILEIGTGSGYQTAVLAVMGARLYTIERHRELSDNARSILDSLGITGVTFRVGDGTLGWVEEAPFDGIVVTAGAPDIPGGLVDQLEVGGRMVIPVGNREGQRLVVVEKGKGIIEKRDAGGCLFVPLVGERGWEGE